MSKDEDVKLHIKVVSNKENTELLFAEAGCDFTDVLLSFLLLPLETIVKVLKKHYGDEEPAIGSLNTLYKGVANLDSVHFRTEAAKNLLVNPKNTLYKIICRGVKLNLTNPTTCDFGKTYKGVFAESAASFIISDDLQLMPNAAGSVIETLGSLNIAMTDMEGAGTRIVSFGFIEFMALLKLTLSSRKPLASILLQRTPMNLATANDDFINFLFGMLTVPLGRVGWYLGSNTGLKSLGYLYGSISAHNFDNHLNEGMKGWLILPPISIVNDPSNMFFPLNFDPNENQNHVKQSRMYMVSDDLAVTTLDLSSTFSVINKLKISLSDVEELELQVGLEEGLRVMKAALTSTTALTDGLIKPMLKEQPKQES